MRHIQSRLSVKKWTVKVREINSHFFHQNLREFIFEKRDLLIWFLSAYQLVLKKKMLLTPDG